MSGCLRRPLCDAKGKGERANEKFRGLSADAVLPGKRLSRFAGCSCILLSSIRRGEFREPLPEPLRGKGPDRLRKARDSLSGVLSCKEFRKALLPDDGCAVLTYDLPKGLAEVHEGLLSQMS